MSAAASGFELTYTIIEPTSLDLNGYRLGAKLVSKKRITGSPQDSYSYWFVKKTGSNYQVQPFRGLYAGQDGKSGDIRTFTAHQMKEHFNVVSEDY